MKIIAAGAFLAVAATGSVARAEHIAWMLTGTNPDVYMPAAVQPAGQDFFHRPGCSPQKFVRPCIGVPFAVLRQAEVVGDGSAQALLAHPEPAVFSLYRR